MGGLEKVGETTSLAKDNRVGVFMFYINNVKHKNKRKKDYVEERTHYGINVFKLREILKYSDVNVQGQMNSSEESLGMGMFLLREDVIPVINLPKWLGKELTKEELKTAKIAVTDFNHTKIGLLIADPYRIEMKSWEQIETSDSYSMGEQAKILNHTRTNETNSICFIIDIEGLLSELSPQTEEKINNDIKDIGDNLSTLTSKYPILIAEDSKVAQAHLRNIMIKANLNFEIFENGKLLLDRFREIGFTEKIPMVITDLEMPVCSGHKVIQEIRTYNKQVPIVVNSSMTSDNNKREVESLGATEFIGKTDSKKIIALIKQYCK